MKCERVRRGWSQQTLALRSAVGIAEISRIESGRQRPYPNQAEKIARALGVRSEDLQEPATLEVVKR